MQKINLLPIELRKDPMVDLKRILRTALITTVVGFLVLTYATIAINNHFKAKELEAIETEISAMEPIVQKVEGLKAELEVNNRKVLSYQELLNEPVPWPNILTDIAFNMPSNLWLNDIIAAKTERTEKVVTGEGESQKEEEIKTEEVFITIQGYAPSLDSIGVFLLHLNTLSALEEIQILKAVEEKDVPIYLLDFEIKAKVKTWQGGGEK